jgi:hypothetical protein
MATIPWPVFFHHSHLSPPPGNSAYNLPVAPPLPVRPFAGEPMAPKRRLPLLIILAAAILPACANLGGSGLPSTQPVPAQKLSNLRQGMTYAQFEAVVGPGWLSTTSPTHEKYWFLDDTRIIAVPPTVWQTPNRPLTFRIIGHAPTSSSRPLLLPNSDAPLLPTRPPTR